MNFGRLLLTSALCILTPATAFEPVSLVLPEKTYWSGERIPVRVELRTDGRFSGVAHFEMPALPRTQVMKAGRPVVGSEQSPEGELFVQRHEFSFFSQVDGELRIPEVEVTFGVEHNGDIKQVKGMIPAFALQVKRPPGMEEGRFVVSSPHYTITQSWSTKIEKFEIGDVLSRTVLQKAENISGMALPPLPQAAGEGVRVYPPQVDISDQTNRGLLTGEREERLRYRFERAGEVVIPAVSYQWWNPATEKLETKRMEGMTVKVKGPIFESRGEGLWKWVTALLVISALVYAFVLFAPIIWASLPRKQSLPPLNPNDKK